MTKTLLFLSIFVLTSCSNHKNTTNVLFQDLQGTMYETSSAGNKVKESFNLSASPAIIVLATRDVKSPLYQGQLNNIYKVDAEVYEYLLVIANSEDINKAGYYTNPEQAKLILGDNLFKIIIINNQGNYIFESTEKVEISKLKRYLTNH